MNREQSHPPEQRPVSDALLDALLQDLASGVYGSGLIAGLAVVIQAAVKKARALQDRQAVEQDKQAYQDRVLLTEAVHRLRRETQGRRAILLVSRNGGGVPAPGVPVKVTAEAESVQDGVTRRSGEWIDRRPDEEYERLLADVARSGGQPVRITTAGMKDGQLKRMYLQDGVVYAKVALVGFLPGHRGMVYVGAGWGEEGLNERGGLSPEQQLRFWEGIERVRRIIGRHNRVV